MNVNTCAWKHVVTDVVCVDIPAAGDDVGVPEEDDCPQLLRTRSDASFMHIQRRSKTRSARDLQRLRTHRFSINGHFYNHKVGHRKRTFCTITVFLAQAYLQAWWGWCFLLHLAVKATMRSSASRSRTRLVCVCWLLAGSSWKDFLTPSFSKHSKCSRNH